MEIGFFGLCCIGTFLGCVILFIPREKKNLFRREDVLLELDNIDNLDGISFEHYTGKLLRKNGFKNVRVTKGSGDFGADVICGYGDATYVVQCKNYRSNVGPKAVQEIYTAKKYYHATNAAVLTNSYFTASAIKLAKTTNVELWDRRKLAELITMTEEERKKQAKEDAFIHFMRVYLGGLSVLFLILSLMFPDFLTGKSSDAEKTSSVRSITVKSERNNHRSDSSEMNSMLADDISSIPAVTQSPTMTLNEDNPPTATDEPLQNMIGIMRKTANVREEPSTESKIVGKAMQDEKIIITKPFIIEKWHQVMFNGEICYISANYCILQE